MRSAHFRQIIAEYPIETEAYARLAWLLYREERPSEAIPSFNSPCSGPEAADLARNVLASGG